MERQRKKKKKEGRARHGCDERLVLVLCMCLHCYFDLQRREKRFSLSLLFSLFGVCEYERPSPFLPANIIQFLLLSPFSYSHSFPFDP